jgi:hypothetical protein
MSNSKISGLPSASTPLTGNEVLPVVQSGATDQVSVSNLTVGRTVETGGLNVKGTQQLYSGNIWLILNSDNTNYYYVTNSGASGSANPQIDFVQGGVGTVLSLDKSQNIIAKSGNFVQGTAAKGINFTANTPAAGMTSQLLNWYEEGTWTPTQGAALTVVGAFSSSGKYTRIGRVVTIVATIQGATSISSTPGIICGGLPYSPANTASGSAAMSSINAGSTLYIPNTNIYAVTAMSGGGSAIIITATFFV